MHTQREYNSPSRDRAKSETRDRIIRAVVAVILDEGIHAFTMQNVAEKAGVSHRTVYRHFPSRERLLEGLSDSLHESIVAAGLPPPRDVSELVAHVGPLFEQFYRFGAAMRASVIAAVALGYQTESQREASAMVHDSLAARFPHIAAQHLRESAAVLRVLISRYSWYVLSIDLGLQPEASGRGVTWAVGALLDDLERRNAAACAKELGAPPAFPKRPNRQPRTRTKR